MMQPVNLLKCYTNIMPVSRNVSNRQLFVRNTDFTQFSAAECCCEINTKCMRKATENLTGLALRAWWETESRLPLRLVGRQAGKEKGECRCSCSLLSSSHLSKWTTTRATTHTHTASKMNYLLRNELEHRAYLVTLMCCMGQYSSYFFALVCLCSFIIAKYPWAKAMWQHWLWRRILCL